MIFLQLLVGLASGVVLFRALFIINKMSIRTSHGIRLACCLCAAGAFGEIASLIEGHVPGAAEALFVTGVGVMAFIDRRNTFRCPLFEDKGRIING